MPRAFDFQVGAFTASGVQSHSVQTSDDVGITSLIDVAYSEAIMVWETDFSGIATGEYLPRSPWEVNENGPLWKIFQGPTGDGHSDVLYNENSQSAMYREMGSPDHRVEADMKVGISPTAIAGVCARVVGPTRYMSFELVRHEGGLPGAPDPESKISLDIRDGFTHYEFTVPYNVQYETYYYFAIELIGDHVRGYINNVLEIEFTMTSVEAALISGGTKGGPINFAGAANFDVVRGFNFETL